MSKESEREQKAAEMRQKILEIKARHAAQRAQEEVKAEKQTGGRTSSDSNSGKENAENQAYEAKFKEMERDLNSIDKEIKSDLKHADKVARRGRDKDKGCSIS